MTLKTDDFDYTLPAELIAQKPLTQRDESRLLHLRRLDGKIADLHFSNLIDLLSPGDLLVMNDTRVVPAKFTAQRISGGKIEGLFLRDITPEEWLVMLRNAGRCKVGEIVSLVGDTETRLELIENLGEGKWRIKPIPAEKSSDILTRVGKVPLPPYIHRHEGDNSDADITRYQTVYAASSGAVAAPTAGLHFTDELLQSLEDKGIEQAFVTLHVGLGTFLPVKADNLDEHQMHSERYEISPETADKLNAAKREGRRIVAVGTTVVRVLETESMTSPFKPVRGETDIFLFPPGQFNAVDAMITNFHLPRSTLLMLISAFCKPGQLSGREMILNTYQHAIDEKYRFYSYGDAMFIS